MVSKIEQFLQKLKTTSTDRTIIENLQKLQNEIIHKDQQIHFSRADIKYLSKETNKREHYSSKNCLVISNLPFVTGVSHSANVLLLLNEYLGLIVNEWDLKACHTLCKVYSELNSQAVFVKFLLADVKDEIWGQNYMLKAKANPKKIPVFFTRNT